MANQKPEKLLHEILNGFLRSRVLTAGYKLNLFAVAAKGAVSREEALRQINVRERSGTILINACLALGLLEEAGDGKIRTPPGLDEHLTRAEDGSFRLIPYLVEYYDALYNDMMNIDEIIRTDGAASTFKLRDYFKEDVNEIDARLAADYSAYMDATMSRIVDVVVTMYDFGKHRHVMDMCGGPATFIRVLLRKYPALDATLVEVPAVAKIAREKLKDADLDKRVDVIAGDAFRVDLGRKADCVTMCRAAHDWDDQRVEALFRRAFDALPSGGRLLVIERMIPDHFDERAEALYMRAVYFLAKSETACYRTVKQYQDMLARIGFKSAEALSPRQDPYEFFQGLRVVVAEKG